jgi:hypothetical protein
MKPAGFIRLGGLAAVVGGGALIRAAFGNREDRRLNRQRRPGGR